MNDFAEYIIRYTEYENILGFEIHIYKDAPIDVKLQLLEALKKKLEINETN